MYGSPRTCVRHFTRFPHLRRPLVVNVPFWVVWWASAQYGSPRTCLLHLTSSEVRSDFQIWFSPSFPTFESLTRCRDTKFIIGFDFAVTLSSPTSSCVLFDIASWLLMELKWLMPNKHKKMIPFITCEISLCQYVCELVLGVNVFDLDLGVQIDSIKQPITSNSVGSGNMSHCWAFLPTWSSWSTLRCLQRCTTKLPYEKNSRLRK